LQVLQDELTTTQLELSSIEKTCAEVKRENTTLVERWIRKMNEEVEKMNVMNEKANSPTNSPP
jgi:autophagy-related protein 16